MSSLERKVKRIQRRNSKGRVVMLVVLLLLTLATTFSIRFYVLEPVRVIDTSMAPKYKEQSILWMCKLPQCLGKIEDGDIVWGELRNRETVVRKILAVPGDSIKITDNGKVYTPHRNFKWRNEDAFIQTRSIRIPKQGDTLILDSLNDVEQDYLISLMHERNEKFFVKTTLWQGTREISIDRIGSTKLGNRQVSLQEIDFMPWQDRFLVELQIFQTEPGNAPIHIKREIFNAEDSSRIEKYVVEDECYYLICEKANHCADSREYGYFSKKRLLGLHVKKFDKVQEFFKTKYNKVYSYIKNIFAEE